MLLELNDFMVLKMIWSKTAMNTFICLQKTDIIWPINSHTIRNILLQKHKNQEFFREAPKKLDNEEKDISI